MGSPACDDRLVASLRGASTPPFRVMEVIKAAHDMTVSGADLAVGGIKHLEVGQPSTGAPRLALDATRDSLDACARGETTLGYTVAEGVDPLRERIARHYRDRYGVEDVDADAVVVTTGSSAAFILSFVAAFDPGDRVAIASPGYPCYRNILEALGCEVVSIPVDASTDYQPTPALLNAFLAAEEDDDGGGGGGGGGGPKPKPKPIRGLIVASPSNPTGTVLTRAQLFALHEWCHERGAWFVSDEIYHQIEYGEDRATTALETPNGPRDCAIVINSFSKYHCMTGWRVGWCVVPPRLRDAMRALQQNLFINAPTIAQHAATAAFDCDDELVKHVDRYRVNREILLRGLPKAGFAKLSSAGGAYYIYADVSDMTEDSVGLCKRILETTGVACVPGVDFDRERGLKFVRFSFCDSTETVTEAVRVLIEKVDEWRVGG